MNKILSAFAIALALVPSVASAQEDVTDKYLVNPSFEYSAEGVAYDADTNLKGESEIYGWTLPTFTSSTSDRYVAAGYNDPSFGTSAASEGSYYFYNRYSWGNSEGVYLSQTTNLPAGRYYVTVDYKGAERVMHYTEVGFRISENDESLASYTQRAACVNPGSTFFGVSPWKTCGAWFTVSEGGDVKISIYENLKCAVESGSRAAIVLDNVRLYKWKENKYENYEMASPATPLDVTSFVTNPLLETATTGWSTDLGTSEYKVTRNKFGAFTDNFLQKWNGSNFSGKIYQTLKNIPNGAYRLTMAAMDSKAAEGTSNTVVYANEAEATVTSADPLFYTVETEVTDNTLEIGIKTTGANWIGLDNVSLEMIGWIPAEEEVKPTAVDVVNSGFDEGEKVDAGICTYDYDMAKNNTTRYGAQAVEGWTAENISDNTYIAGRTDATNSRAAGELAWGSEYFLGGAGYLAPAADSEGATDGAALGLIAVWGATVKYTQPLTLTAGNYRITYAVNNVGGTTAVSKNLIGFVANDGTEYYGKETTWTVGSWTTETIEFQLPADAEGNLSVGYVAAGAGSGKMPHLFVDYIKVENLTATLDKPAFSVEDGATIIAKEVPSIAITFPNAAGLDEETDYTIKATARIEVVNGVETTVIDYVDLEGTPADGLTYDISGLKAGKTYCITFLPESIKLYDGDTQVFANQTISTVDFHIANDFEATQIYFEREIAAAQDELDNAIVGVNVFQYLPVTAAKYQKVINEAKAQLASCTSELTLNDAIYNFRKAKKDFQPTLPKVNEKFLIRHKSSGFYMCATEGLKVVPKADATPLYFHQTEEGNWYIYNTDEREYIGYLGTNPWSMSNANNDEFAVSATGLNIHYILGENGYLGTDDPTTDTNVYGDKAKNANSQWFIEYYTVDPLTNLTFDEGSFIDNGVCTYDYDCEKNATPYSQMQDVKGWSMGVVNGNARAAAQYSWGSESWLGGKGYNAPATDSEGSTEGGALGLVGVWTGTVQYVQSTTLLAGTHTITVPVYNAGGTGAFSKNLIGFIANDGTEYLTPATSYAVGEWTIEQITFTLDKDTKGNISLGYAAANAGSGSMPHLFIDYVKVADGTPENGDSDATAINGVSSADAPAAIYSANGTQIRSMQKGVNIVKMADGTVKKIMK